MPPSTHRTMTDTTPSPTTTTTTATNTTTESDRQFLKDLDAKLWAAADKLRNNLHAAQYKHAVLCLIFLKYVSNAFTLSVFTARRKQIKADLQNPDSDLHYPDASDDDLHAELEDRDYYTSQNTFWVRPLAC
jgi:type I restriction enzyme M protein